MGSEMKRKQFFENMPNVRLVPAVIIAAILTTAACKGIGMEQNETDRTDREREPRHLARELDLDNNQMEAMRSRMQSNRENFSALHQKRDRARTELEELLADKASDETSIKEAGKRLAEINAEITMQQVESRMELRRTLNPEQYQRLQKLRENMREKHFNQRQDQRLTPRPDRVPRRRKTE
ncbi:MAG: periplasmic heavy metal sensor [Lentisphaerae bacterium]|nr:periplasmic heavy metal sensor [Lentisphaerota bacterium]